MTYLAHELAARIAESKDREGVVRVYPGEHWGESLQRMLHRVHTEVLVAVGAPLRMQGYYLREALVLRDLLATGKRIRVLYSRDYARSRNPAPGTRQAVIDSWTKVAPMEFPNALIIDRAVGVLWSPVTVARPEALVIRDPALLGYLHRFTTTTWDSAVRLRPDPEFDGLALAVLDSLATGLKDEVAARRLAVSVRTYRRQVAALLDRLEVETRYQLGVRVAELGIGPGRAQAPGPDPAGSCHNRGDST
ncbi:hypothetical protein AB0H76_04185 [Nocardia sp. NPDC050712]|uniref:hypothetical protein n=1 Tax=Nocardia sp. NPDC050712 TaxID=3155518 RepID=UPI0033CD4C64